MIHAVNEDYSADFIELENPKRESVLIEKLEDSGLKFC